MISVIIPVYNDGKSISRTLAYLYAHAPYKRLLKEVIVVDGGSSDDTVAEAEKTGATVMRCPEKSRVAQLNYGAQQATGTILYFMQPSATPPPNFIAEIAKAHSRGYACGTFSLQYDAAHWLLKTVTWATVRCSHWLQISDQSLFVTRELFEKTGGFRSDHLVMANQELIRRLKRYADFVVLQDSMLCSASRYVRSGFLRTGLLQATVYLMHKLGYSQFRLTGLYRRFLRWDIGPKLKPRTKAAVSTEMLLAKEGIKQMAAQ